MRAHHRKIVTSVGAGVLAAGLGLSGLSPASATTASTSTTSSTASTATATATISRSTIISRARTWVTAHVPYNQQGYHRDPQGKLYREDCSGYVSMAWHLRTSYVTSTLPQVSHRITKTQLRPGDVMLKTSGHVVIFNGWANTAHTKYNAMEESRPGVGTVARVTPYPYWSGQGTFVPYRLNGL
ncbi:cell wall-associated hydrolase [Tersicoccus sp. MR15.9]|uniref:cell wall-associated hydrolase n=1 Tax=Tersicoccus mangrovi TaxID=3121635 RepID=UPI002FE5978E